MLDQQCSKATLKCIREYKKHSMVNSTIKCQVTIMDSLLIRLAKPQKVQKLYKSNMMDNFYDGVI